MLLTTLLVLAFFGAALSSALVLAPRGDQAVLDRAAAIRRGTTPAAPAASSDEERTGPFRKRVIDPLLGAAVAQMKKRAPKEMRERVRQRLVESGMQLEADRFLGLQALTALGVGVGASVVFFGQARDGQVAMYIGLIGLFAFGGWRLPGFNLSRLISKRRKAIEKALPEVLDLLSVSVEAGLGFDGAIAKVAERFPEPTSGEFRSFLREVRLGNTRAESLRRLAERSGSPDMKTFCAAVIQADQLGVSMAKVLRAQSEAMRVKRKQRAEEKAMQLPLKLLFPLILFIFPTLFIIILGPVAISFMSSMNFN